MVVFIVALLVTTLSNMPLVFLRLAEIEEGERDLVLTPGGDVQNQAQSLDYTKFAATMASFGGDYSYHAPRVEFKFETAPAVNPARCEPPVAASMAQGAPFEWFYESATEDCAESAYNCLPYYCRESDLLFLDLMVLDTAKEKDMGVGRAWPYDPPGPGEVILSKAAAKKLQVAKGESFLMTAVLTPSIVGLYNEMKWTTSSTFPYSQYKAVAMPLRVAEVTDDTHGKLPSNADDYAIMEFGSFLDYVGDYLDPAIPDSERTAFKQADLAKYATEVTVNLPPPKRRNLYSQSNYDTMQEEAVAWMSQVVYNAGFNQVATDPPILSYMRSVRFFTLFLGLLVSLVVVVLMCLAVLLIYSLLMINVETRTFELGILRMVGMQRPDLVQLVLVQAYVYALPAWVLGLLVSWVVWLQINSALESELMVSLPTGLDGLGVGLATLLGLAVPILASIVPIKSALGLSLQDALDTQHSKTKAVTFNIERSEGSSFSGTVVGVGAAMALMGLTIYLFFPLALLTFNIALLFYIFFGVLLGLLFGLVLLSLNFELIISQMLTKIFFFWENNALQTLILKNLIAHKTRNRKTTLMYAMSLGFLIWITVSWELQIQSVSFRKTQQLGGDLRIQKKVSRLTPALVAKVERTLEGLDEVGDWGFVVDDPEFEQGVISQRLRSLGRFQEFKAKYKAVSPNFLADSVVDTKFMKVEQANESHGVAPSAQLYTPWNTDRAIIGSLYFTETQHPALVSGKPGLLAEMEVRRGSDNKDVTVYTPLKASTVLNAVPVGRMSKFPARKRQDVYVSVPLYMALTNGQISSMQALVYQYIVVKLKDGVGDKSAAVEKVKDAVIAGMAPEYQTQAVKIKDLDTELKAIRTAEAILNTFFMVVSLLAMSMCFFSLIASMYSNIHAQTKEIGILRSLGLTVPVTKRLYIWEAFVLVTTASILGFLVGTLVAYTMVIQRQLFLQLPLEFNFPFVMFAWVVLLAFVFAIASSYGPTSRLLQHSIVSILRMTN
eukprot:TRINITY_DN11637_c1_g1_i1.p1 TRINITY_DN11637_c1_g1~~TRINITY_DN11637_c1_g1_i1.p1  ORF type:complete len:1005 (+),score=334.65 TRINITY_DN11637_c1_g1_i1:293-3307(+)